MLIQLRIRPEGKMRAIFQSVRQHCRVRHASIPKVPHLSIYGSFEAGGRSRDRIVQILKEVGRKHSYIPLVIDGYDYKLKPDGRYVISFRIRKSPELEKLREELVHTLDYSRKEWDRAGSKTWFHITIANNADKQEFERIWAYLNSEKKWYWHTYGMRMCLMGKNRIIREYDFLTGRILSRNEALDKRIWNETFQAFRKKAGIEISVPVWKPGLKRYIISDLHLDHENIIKYCGRPFRSITEMNRVLEDNWNNVVKPEDTVYYLGDLVFGRHSKGASYWLDKLNGKISFIGGNHERSLGKDWEKVKIGEREFLLLHDPAKKPFSWDGWIIHGHKHNNDMNGYPFINGEKKTINVSAELLNYLPLDLDFLLGLDLDNIAKMDTVSSNPVMKGEVQEEPARLSAGVLPSNQKIWLGSAGGLPSKEDKGGIGLFGRVLGFFKGIFGSGKKRRKKGRGRRSYRKRRR